MSGRRLFPMGLEMQSVQGWFFVVVYGLVVIEVACCRDNGFLVGMEV